MGEGSPVFIIAEAGVNHNGNPDIAHELIRKAAAAGVQCVKFQTFKSERVVANDAPKAAYQLITTDPKESQLDMLQKLELPLEAYSSLMACAAENNIVMISTPYNREDVDFLDRIGISAFKLASIHLVEPFFLKYVAQKGKPIILSTGMGTMEEVKTAVDAILETGNDQLVLLQCTTQYPSRIEDANLRAMQSMQEACNVAVGYSDHTQGNTACIGAVALGACMIEKHFTLDPEMEGPDHSTSVDPRGLKELVEVIRDAEMMLGSGNKVPCEVEKKNAPGMRRSIYTKTNIEAGQVITEDMLTFKRPGTGLAPIYMDRLIGRVALRPWQCDEPVSLEVVEE